MAPKKTTRSTPATTTTPTTSVTDEQLKRLIDQGVTDALVARDIERSQNGEDNHDSGTGIRRQAPPAREYTYPDIMKYKPLYFKGTEGVVKLTQTVGHDVAYAMTWTYLKKKMTDKYCPRGEIMKLEVEMMFPEESDKIEKYVGGLPDMIHGSVMASKPKTMQDAIEFATELMDKKIRTFDDRQSENKRKQDDNQQQQNKRQNTGRAYAVRSGKKKPYGGSKPLCSKCNYYHDGPCAPKCHKCNRVGHLPRDCRSTANANTANSQRGPGVGQKPTCYECGAQGYFKRDCPKLKNNNRGNQGGNGNASTKVYAVGREGTNPDSNVVTSTFLLNNRYASVLFDTGADRSFVSTAFSSQIDITPSTLDHYYDVELADGRIIGLNAIIQGCTLNFLNHPFNIDLMPVELGSLDVIIMTGETRLVQTLSLENKVKSSQARRKARIIVSDDEDDLEDPSKQGRKIDEIDQDLAISLDVSTAEKDVSTAKPVPTASTAVTTASVAVSTAKDKGKAKMNEFETETTHTKTKLQQEQERLGYEAAVRLQAKLEEEERQRIARVHEAASSFNVEECEDIQARVEADEELAQRLQAVEREMYTEAEQARMLHMGGYTLQQLRGYSFDEIKNLFETTMRKVHTFVPIESEIERVIPELAVGSSKRDAKEELDQESSKRQKTGESSELAEEPRD
ncbi:reverse transcriptase domain-containing protein [Tanacetum coccineum]